MSENKGEINYIVILIFFVLLLTILLFFAGKISNQIKEQSTKAECKSSVFLISKLNIRGNDIKQYPLKCPTNRITVKKEEEVFPMVANEIATLWDNFGEGKLDLFDPRDEVFCVLGSYITFEGLDKKMNGFLPYLAEKSYRKSSYLEFLTGVKITSTTKFALSDITLQRLDAIDATKPLGIIYVYSKDAHLTKQEGLIYGLGIGTVVGIAAGIATLIYFPPAGVSMLGFTLISPLAIGTAQMSAVTTISALAGSGTGYLFGYDESSDWDARVITIPFSREEINKLPCTYWPVPTV